MIGLEELAQGFRHGKYVPALGYRWLTSYYDAIVSVTTRERTFKNALIKQAELESGHRVLDLTCGTGTLSIWIKEATPQIDIVGIDGDPDILAVAARKAERTGVSISFETAMSYALPFPDCHFDRVVSSLFFHHLSLGNKVRTAKEIHRVLKPSGQLHVADRGRAENPAMRALFLSIQVLDGFANTQDNVAGRLAVVFEYAGLTDVLERQSFRTIFGTMGLFSASKSARLGG